MIEPARRRVEILLDARTEIAAAFDWYEEQGPGLGYEFLRAVDATLESISRTPDLYRVLRSETRRALLRRFPYGVFFRVTADAVVIQAVVHARQNPQVWERRTTE